MSALNWKCGLTLLTVASGSVFAAPGTIEPTITPSGTIPLGTQITVTLRISGYTDLAEIDGFNFGVSYPQALFTFVPGSFELGAGIGPDQQWLSKANQDFDYGLADFNEGGTTAGTVFISMADLGYSTNQTGTVASDGYLVAFKLLATGKGTGNITPQTCTGPTVLFDSSLSPAGIPALNSVTVDVSTPQPTLTVTPSGPNVVLAWPDPSTGFLLESKTDVSAVSWNTVGAPVVVNGGQKTVTLPATNSMRYFRLRCPP